MINAPLCVAIRADASATSGLGHIKRCLALGRVLMQLGSRVTVVSRASDVDVHSVVQGAGLEHLLLARDEGPSVASSFEAAASESAQESDANETAGALIERRPSWVVVDHYALGRPWHAAMRSALGSSIAVIDDLADRPLQADWVLNHNLSADPTSYERLTDRGAHILCGPRYALLDAEYAQAPRCEIRGLVHSIGIFMGGTDRANLSSRALEGCREVAGFRGPIEVASTAANPHLEGLRESCRRWPETSLLLDAPNLAGFFARHGLQIGAGGGATWERCRIGAPALLLLAAQNQRAVIQTLAARGVVACLEPFEATDPVTIGRAVRALVQDPARRRQMSEDGRRLVDGLGAQRAALSLAATALTVRRALLDDGAVMHAWRNAKETRAVSFEARDIPLEQHMRWLADALADPRRLLLVGQVGPRRVGVIRFDSQTDNWSEVSLYLDPELHGLGLGQAMLAAGEKHAAAAGIAAAGFVARIVDGNARSAGMFAAAGYVRSESAWTKRRGVAETGVKAQ